MRPLKEFNYFLEKGIVKRITPDIRRANSIILEAKRRKAFLEKVLKAINLSDEDSNNIIENSYDILIELIRAKMLLDGFLSTGFGAHEAEVTYLKVLGFPDKAIRLMNDLRYYRNGILYYGKVFDSEYSNKILNLLENLYPILNSIVDKEN